jgi:hypothetical protein
MTANPSTLASRGLAVRQHPTAALLTAATEENPIEVGGEPACVSAGAQRV